MIDELMIFSSSRVDEDDRKPKTRGVERRAKSEDHLHSRAEPRGTDANMKPTHATTRHNYAIDLRHTFSSIPTLHRL